MTQRAPEPFTRPPFTHPRVRDLAAFLDDREGRATGLLAGAMDEARASGATESETSSVRPRLDTVRIERPDPAGTA